VTENVWFGVQLEEQDAKALAKEAKKARREEEKEQAKEEKRKAKGENRSTLVPTLTALVSIKFTKSLR
jgi:hypothetical protein